MSTFQPSPRTQFRRHPERGSHDHALAYQVLDQALFATVAAPTARGVIAFPMAFVRVGNHVFFHGAPVNLLIESMRQEVEVCVSATLIDGLVLARSAFAHSMNYRSLIVYGRAREVADFELKSDVFREFVERYVPGRSREVRGGSEAEINATTLVGVELEQVSVKRKHSPPRDLPWDVESPAWAGVLPTEVRFGEPRPDERSRSRDLPMSLQRLRGLGG